MPGVSLDEGIDGAFAITMPRPYRFAPPTMDDWAASWAPIEDPDTQAAYLDACWTFDADLQRLLPDGAGHEALEIGCYPGGFMRYLNTRFHYRVSGIDYVPAAAGLEERLRADGVDVGAVRVADIREVDPEPRFDLVASFGFIEHFSDPRDMLRLHTNWLAPRGWLVVEVPHFRRVQWALHRAFDDRSLRAHNLKAMSRRLIGETLTELGLDIRHLGYVGVCGFWFEPDARGTVRATSARAARSLFGKADNVLRRAPVDLSNPMTSPYLLCVAQRR